MLETLPSSNHNPAGPGIEPQPLVETPAPKPGWLDLVLYLLIGIGGLQVLIVVVLKVLGLLDSAPLLLATAVLGSNFLVLSATTYLLGVYRGKFSWEEIGFWPPRMKAQWLFLAGALTLVLLFIRMAIGIAFVLLFPDAAAGLEARQQLLTPELSWGAFLVTLVGAGLLAPFSEELFFRGAIYQWFRKRFGYAAAVAGSSILFGLAHIDSPAVLITAFIMGVALAIVYEKTRSIWVTILMHALNNSLAVLISYGLMALLKLLGINL